MKSFLLLGFLAFGLPAYSYLEVVGIKYQGEGCPEGSVRVDLDPRGQSFTLLYDQLDARVSRGQTRAEMRCKVTLSVRKPKWLGYSIEAAEFRGFVNLDRGVEARHEAKIQSGYNRGWQKLSTEFGIQSWQGPLSESFVTRTTRLIKGNHQDVVDCLPLGKRDSEIVVDTQIQVQSRQGRGFGMLAVDSADGVLRQRYHLRWSNCLGKIAGALKGIGRP